MAEQVRLITAEIVRSLLSYDRDTGVFLWLKTLSTATPAGSVAGTIYANGRRYITIERKRYFAAHLAWLYVTGGWPVDQIDHKNLSRSDDRFENLREATGQQNIANRGVLKNNRSGFKGVSKRPRTRFSQRWRARIRVNGILINLGDFNSPEEANAAYAKAAQEHFGEFARAA
jgi:hypothetical protein